MACDPTTHPNTKSLAAFSLGKLDDDESAALVEHLETCAVCQQTVEETPPDTFLEALHAARPVSEGTLPPELANHPRFRIVRELGRGGMGLSTSPSTGSWSARSPSRSSTRRSSRIPKR
jgi:hypothetical protein